MKRNCVTILLSILLCMYAPGAYASEEKLPVIDGMEVVALVNEEPITLEEFSRALGSIEHDKVDMDSKASSVDYSGILNRMIDEKLFLQEAKNIGLHELPDVKKALENNKGRTLAEILVRKQLKDIQADADDVEKLYKEAIKEWKITGILFEKEDAAKAMEEELKSGGSFDGLYEKHLKDESAKEGLKGEYLKNKDLWPQVADIITKMEIGSISPIVSFDKGFVIFRLEDIRYPENQMIRDNITRSAVRDKKEEALDEYGKSLIKKYVKVDLEKLNGIDYASMEEFEKLLNDEAVIARISKDRDITVGELSRAFEEKHYHGVEDLIKRKLLNGKKYEMLDDIMKKRVYVIEAKKQGIDKTDTYKNRIEKFENSLLLGQFVEKVAVPDVKITEEELQEYHKGNQDKYMYPEMMRLRSLAFDERSGAESAADKLKAGTDFKWLSANAEGQAGKGARKPMLQFDGRAISMDDLPEGMKKAVSGSKPQDARLYEGPDGFFYLMFIQDIIPASPKPFNEIRKEIAEVIYNDKLNKVMQGWAAKLREYYDVKVYLTKF